MESPRLEPVQGAGLMLWCLQKAQLSAAFTYDSPGKPPCQLQHSTASRTICCHLASTCPALCRDTAREGQPWPPQCPSAAGGGPHAQSHPAQRKQNRTDQAMNNHTPFGINNKATASYTGLFRPYPLSRSRDGLGFLPTSRFILQLSAYCGICRASKGTASLASCAHL